MRQAWLTALALAGAFLHPSAAAFSLSANFSGQLIEPPLCQVNGNKPIAVEFGPVIISQINGDNYKQPVPWDIVCSGTPDKSMRIKLSGTPGAFDANLLATSQPDLAIRIVQGKTNETQLPLNSWLPFTWPTLPDIKLAPAKKSQAQLSAGDFTAVADLVVEYQ